MSDLVVERLRRMAHNREMWIGDKDSLVEAADRIDELESRLADKDASIAQLIEQLQRAEAQNAAPGRVAGAARAFVETPLGDGRASIDNFATLKRLTNRTSEGAK